MFECQDDESVERWIVKLLPFLYLLLIERDEVVLLQQGVDIVVWVERLYDDFSLLSCSSCSSADLFQHLEGSFVTTEVRLVDEIIRL